MNWLGPDWPRFGERSLADRAAGAAEDLQLYRDLRFSRGSAESYRLTGLIGELVTAAAMLRLSPGEQEAHAQRLLGRGRDYLAYLRRGCDA